MERLPLDEQTDIFFLGVVLYEMVLGRKTLVSYGDIAIMKSVLTNGFKLLSSYWQQGHRDFDPIILKALAKKPEDRHASTSELKAEFIFFSGGICPKKTLLSIYRFYKPSADGIGPLFYR